MISFIYIILPKLKPLQNVVNIQQFIATLTGAFVSGMVAIGIMLIQVHNQKLKEKATFSKGRIIVAENVYRVVEKLEVLCKVSENKSIITEIDNDPRIILALVESVIFELNNLPHELISKSEYIYFQRIRRGINIIKNELQGYLDKGYSNFKELNFLLSGVRFYSPLTQELKVIKKEINKIMSYETYCKILEKQ